MKIGRWVYIDDKKWWLALTNISGNIVFCCKLKQFPVLFIIIHWKWIVVIKNNQAVIKNIICVIYFLMKWRYSQLETWVVYSVVWSYLTLLCTVDGVNNFSYAGVGHLVAKTIQRKVVDFWLMVHQGLLYKLYPNIMWISCEVCQSSPRKLLLMIWRLHKLW